MGQGSHVDWTRAIDVYCERTDPSFWSEPINAATNLAFIVGALVMWRRTGGLLLGRVLVSILFGIGIGSFLFHSFGTVWAALADVVPIAVFILVYTYAANRTFWDLSMVPALGLTILFLPYAALGALVFSRLPFLSISAEYWPVPLFILAYAWLLRARAPDVSRGLQFGAGLLILSLVVRSLDGLVCDAFPIGTHFAWHLLNGVMLAWMIEVWRRAASGQFATD